MIAIGFLTMNWPFATEILWLAVILTIYSGYEYTRDYFKKLKAFLGTITFYLFYHF